LLGLEDAQKLTNPSANSSLLQQKFQTSKISEYTLKKGSCSCKGQTNKGTNNEGK